ncbi:GDSL esterase/lipase APG-like [Rhododendron vialii]|uniref:GDSL esterase/lipase APG-like n=1 Tax=Rhododendron vialii TaxID=182163 RepID=UPI00265DF662|nr:GDSL esterase/lipase APG-like [Rhododendron vialii]
MCLFFHVVLFSVWIAFENADAQHFQLANSSMFCSLYSFGDSFVDPGNNNYIATNARSNFPPYGNDFPGRNATGRFSNGLLFPDFLAYFLGSEKYPLAYLGGELDFEEPVTAVSFASAGSGYDPATSNKTEAIQLWQQLQFFKEYKADLRNTVGKNRANSQIKAAVFYVHAGSADFALNYFREPFNYFDDAHGSKASSPLPEYEHFLLKRVQRFIQGLWVQGARKFAVSGLPPLGCIPIGITNLPPNPKNSETVQNRDRKCLEHVNDVSEEFNSLLVVKLQELQSKFPETNIAYIDFEVPLLDAIQDPSSYGFNEVNKGCCGTGLTETGLYCNETTPICSDASQYVFWDAVHPTETTNEIIFASNLDAINEIIEN